MDNLWLKVENIVVKGEVAHHKQILLLPQCFQKAVCCRGCQKASECGKVLNNWHALSDDRSTLVAFKFHKVLYCLSCLLNLSHLKTHLETKTADDFWKHCEIAKDEQFLLWPQCFQLYWIIKLSFMEILQVFVSMLSKSSAANLLYMAKG